jgi:hypothetical protein
MDRVSMFEDTFTLIVFFGMFAIFAGWIYVVSQNAHNMHKQVRQIAEQHTLIHSDKKARDICRAVHQLHPLMHAGVDFVIKRDGPGEQPYIAEWNAAQPKPTVDELKAVLPTIPEPGEDYKEFRRAEYPSVGDQLDAAYKVRHGDNSEQIEIDAKIAEVKARYPKSDYCP